MDMEKVIEVLISLLEEQEGVEIKYEIEKTLRRSTRWTSRKGMRLCIHTAVIQGFGVD